MVVGTQKPRPLRFGFFRSRWLRTLLLVLGLLLLWLLALAFGLNAYPSPTPTSRYVSLSSQLDFLWGEVRYYATYLVRRPWLNKDANYMAIQPCQ